MDRSVYLRMAAHEEIHWWFAARRQIVTRLIRLVSAAGPARDPATPQILEVGCGTGGNLPMLKQFGAVTAVECDRQARDIATAKSDVAIIDGRLPDLAALGHRTFDLVLLLDVLEHVDDDLAALSTLAPRQGADGVLLVTVPAHPWLWSAHDVVHHHYRRYTPASLRVVAEKAGYRVESIGYYMSLLFPAVVAVRMAKRLIGADTADDAMPGPLANRVLKAIFAFERFLVGRVPLPIGTSLFMIARPDRRTVPAASGGVAKIRSQHPGREYSRQIPRTS